jgi:phage shock protein C
MSRRLYRSLDDRVIAGVAGGMAESYDLDPAVVRIGWALLILFTGGVFLILYIIMALVVPVRPDDELLPMEGEQPVGDESTAGWVAGQPPSASPRAARRARRKEGGDNTGPLILGAVLIMIGALFLIQRFVSFDLGQLWPIAIIGLGAVLIVSAFARRERRP